MLSRALTLAFLAFIGACAPRFGGEGPEVRIPMIEQVEGTAPYFGNYVTRDGLKLGLMLWEAAEPKAVVVALHGMSDYSNAFAIPAPFWAEQGITTYAYDQRSFGRSPMQGVWPGNDYLRRDLRDFVDVLRERHPGVPVLVLGESMGGAVAMTAFASESPPMADGLILVAPAVWSRQTMPLIYRLALWTTAHFTGWLELSGARVKVVATDNIELLRANGRDPLFQKSARADALYGFTTLMDEAYRSPSDINSVPILFTYGGIDQIIPRGPTEQVIARLGSNATVRLYPDGYHMLLRDLKAQPRWAEIAVFVSDVSEQRQSFTVMAE